MRWILLCALLLPLNVAASAAYQWTDALGRTHFSDRPPPEGTHAIRVPIGGSTSDSAAAQAQAAAPSPRLRHRRCTDFRGAIVQLEEIATPGARDTQWHQAREIAVNGVARWCDDD